jgi:hypothetical protein
MKKVFGIVAVSLSVLCGNSFAFDFFGKGEPSGSSGTAATTSPAPKNPSGSQNSSSAKGRVGPVVGGMLEDGREVPARFRDKKTRARQNSELRSTQKDDEDSSGN